MMDIQILLSCRLFRVEQVTFSDAQDRRHTRQIVRHPGSVVIVPIVDPSHVCLIRNYRCAVDETLIELPAGTREEGEQPEATALRELEEETGYRAEFLRHVCDFFPAPGILDERMKLYVAEGLTAGEARREPGEQIENLVLPWETALRMVHDGTIRDAKTMLGLLLTTAEYA